MKNTSRCISMAKSVLMLTAFVPLIITQFSVYPFMLGKSLAFTGLLEIALFFAFLSVFFSRPSDSFKTSVEAAGPQKYLWFSLGIFFISMLVSTLFSPNVYQAFWGLVEKGDGLFNLIHFLIFALLITVLFERKDWESYAKIHIAVALIISFAAWVQFITLLPQPTSTMGNAAYLALYLTLVLAFVSVVFTEEQRKKHFGIYLSFFAFIVGAILITETRAALLGLFVSVVVWMVCAIFKTTNTKVRKIVVTLLVSGSLFAALFLATRAAEVWKNVPVLKRFATLEITSGSLQERFAAWRAGIEGFKVHPVVGWGSGQFEHVYNTYGHTDIEEFKESWFTSAHNKIIDTLVEGGIFGLISYIFVCIALVLGLRKNVLGMVFFAAYFIQNIFIFDTTTSYLMFFTLTGFALSSAQKEAVVSRALVLRASALILALCVCTIFFIYVMRPIAQQLAYGKFYRTASEQELQVIFNSVTMPYTPQQPAIRRSIIELLQYYGAVKDPRGRPLFIRSVESLAEVVEKNPDDAYAAATLIESYLDLGDYDLAYFHTADAVAQKMIERAPNVYRFVHLRAFALIGLERYQEARELLASVLSLYPESARTLVYLALLEDKTDAADFQVTLDNAVLLAEKQSQTFEKRDFKTLISLLAQKGEAQSIRTITQLAVLRYPREKNISEYADTFDKCMEIHSLNECRYSIM